MRPFKTIACGLWILLVLLAARPVAAQAPEPALTAYRESGGAGAAILLSGANYPLGNGIHQATVRWDGVEIATPDVSIVRGNFILPLVIPLEAGLGDHRVTVCIGAECASAAFPVTAQAPFFQGTIAYVYDQDNRANLVEPFRALLARHGLALHPIPLQDVLATDFGPFDLVLIGDDTGPGQAWGSEPGQAEHIATEGRKVLALGQGGYAFLAELGMSIGTAGLSGNFGRIMMAEPLLSYYHAPADMGSFEQYPLDLYPTEMAEAVAISVGRISPSAFALAWAVDDSSLSPVAAEGCFHFWGYRGGPDHMTAVGQALFANAVLFAMGMPCATAPEATCQELFGPADVPGAERIDFDDMANGAAIGDFYAPLYGVRFEANEATRALVYGNEPDEAASSPNVAINDAVSGSSANVPMRITFDALKTHVGFFMGNRESAEITGTLTAFDPFGEPICQVSQGPVPEPHTGFMGVYDAYGRIAAIELDYGDSPLSESMDDLLFAPHFPRSEIRVCVEQAERCQPAVGATVYRIQAGPGDGEAFGVDGQGYVEGRRRIHLGDRLWATLPMTATGRSTVFHASGQPEPVTAGAFNQDPAGTLALVVSRQDPLMLHDLDVSAQWNLEGDPAYKETLRSHLLAASDFLYDFTDGQMALGTVNVYQNYEGWADADLWLYAANSLRPKAQVGGVVVTPTVDLEHADLSYFPGQVHMGSTWNRFHLPGNVVDPELDLSQDWPLAMAHELGHYLLFLYDTYLALTEASNVVETDTCTGSAMGWVYEPQNWEFVFDPGHWNANCGDTVANLFQKRTEWETIHLWYPWTIQPTAVTPGPPAPPTGLTSVTFQPPMAGTLPLANQVFDLIYQDGEASSAAARAFLMRSERVLDQGKPAEGATEMELHGAQAGDRFCVFDVSDLASGAAMSRQQFGCEVIEVGDQELALKKDTTWGPVVLLTPVTTQTVAISVTQPISAATLMARHYPEHETGGAEIVLAGSGEDFSGMFELDSPATAAYVQVWVEESASELNPRREILVDYGVGGGGVGGPVHQFGGVAVVSSDGQATYVTDQPIELGVGEFIALQSMAGVPALPVGSRMAGQAYRLMALPAPVADTGSISIRYGDLPSRTQAAGSRSDLATELAIHHWNGDTWRSLATELTTEPGGSRMASAPSQGVGVYGLLEREVLEPGTQVYLPMVHR